ncbi:MAG: histidine triad (HIT) family protein [Kiritimatiellia bacterium]|jgi:histidine triad (HIT) family protein
MTLFTRIINGEIPCHKLYEDEHYFSFLDIRPMKPGHALVIPKVENDYIFDLDDDILAGLLVVARPIARAIEQCVDCSRIGLMVAGLEVPHTHVHLVPISSVGDLNFAHATETPPEELVALAAKIRGVLA